MILRINAKCSDLCIATLTEDDGTPIAERDGYVPDFMPGDHYGDYVLLNIDPKTGQILNWPKNGISKSKMILGLK